MNISTLIQVFFLTFVVSCTTACSTTPESKKPNVPCVFPFIYKGKTYNGCTQDSDPDGKQWCATKVDEFDFYIEKSGEYGYCSEECFERDSEVDIRTIDDNILEKDRRCNSNEKCKRQTNCPNFLEQRKKMNSLRRGSPEWKTSLDKLRGSVCNKSQRGVCCPEEKTETCDGGEQCLTENQCPHAQELRRRMRNGDTSAKKELISLICNRKKRTFCCPKKQPLTNVLAASTQSNNNYIKSPSWLPGEGECGRPGRPGFVVGGKATRPGEFPFTVLIGYHSQVKNQWIQAEFKFKSWNETRYKCGGTLINHWYVLTAAHCISKSILSVRLGEWEVLEDPDCEGSLCIEKVQDIDVDTASIRKHEAYEQGFSNVLNDIALIKLSQPAVLNLGVQIVCLPVDPVHAARKLGLKDLHSGLVGKRPTVVGWGYTEYDPYNKEQQGDFKRANVASTSQQKLEIPVLSTSECTRKFGKFVPEDSQICAGAEIGKDSCKGDSGGPLYYSHKVGSENTWYLLGLVSFGTKQCGSGKPGVYTRVESFVPWIKRNLI